jgi:hypothetical protein
MLNDKARLGDEFDEKNKFSGKCDSESGHLEQLASRKENASREIGIWFAEFT